jgi:hypothetical protein
MARRTRPSSTAALVRALSLVVAGLCVLAQLAGAGHFLLVSHTVCLEHGELIHGAAHHEVTPVKAETQRSALEAADDADDDHGHDHCVLPSHKSDADAVARATRVATARPTAPVLELVVPEARAAVVPPRARILLVAPKSSPPAAALVG